MPLPSEVALAHHGMRLLDERSEFRRPLLVGRRQPLEEAWQRYNLPHILNLVAWAALAALIKTLFGSSKALSEHRHGV